MSHGFARLVAKQFPQIHALAALNIQPEPGSVVSFFDPHSRCYIYNLIVPKFYCPQSTLSLLEQALSSLRIVAEDHNVHELSLPRLNCGLPSLSWQVTFELICSISSDSTLQVSIFLSNVYNRYFSTTLTE